MNGSDKIVYMIQYQVQGCAYEIRVNDFYIDSSLQGLGGGNVVINNYIPHTGQQFLSFQMLPLPGENKINENSNIDICITRTIVDTANMSVVTPEPIMILEREKEQYSGIVEFYADIPYSIILCSNSKKISSDYNTVESLIGFYEELNILLKEKRGNELISLLEFHENNQIKSLYWDIDEDIRKQRNDDLWDLLTSECWLRMPGDDEICRLFGNGRAVRFVKPDGSPALTICTKDDEYIMDWYFHIPEGKSKFCIL